MLGEGLGKKLRLEFSVRPRGRRTQLRRKVGGIFGLFVTILAIGGFVIWQALPTQAAPLGNLAAYWKFDESTAGSTATDFSGNNNNLTPTNSPSPSTDVPSAMGTAFSDSHSVSFDGSTQYFSVADNSTFDNTSAVSISTWVKFNNVSGNQTIAAKWQVGVKQQWVLQLDSSAHISWWTGDGGSGSTDQLTSSTSISSGTWHHIVATATSGAKKLYINGSLDNSDTGGTMGLASNTPVTVGSKMNSSSTFFEYLNGNVDDMRVYSRVLNATEASDLASGTETTATWTGSSSTDFDTGSNWDIGAVPDHYTDVVIPQATYRAVLGQDVSAASVTISAAGILDLNGFHVSLNDTNVTPKIENHGTVISQNSESGTSLDTTDGTVMYDGTVSRTGLTFGNSYHDLEFNDGLLNYYKFDEGSGTTPADSSGYGNNATIAGGATYDSANLPSTHFANSNSMNFSGSNLVNVTDAVPAEVLGSAPKTLGMWVRPTQLSEGFAWLGPFGGGGQGQSWRLQSDSSGFLKLDISSGVESSTLKITLNTWQYIAAKWDGSNWQICLNTSCQTLSSLPASNLQPGFFQIGRGDWLSTYMKGNIDDVRLYDRALTQTEIDNLAGGDEPGTSLATTTLNSNLTVNNLTLSSGTLAAGSNTLTVSGDFENDGGVFSPDTSTVSLNGGDQTINSSNTFYILAKHVTAPHVLTFGEGSTTTVNSQMALSGTSGKQLSLVSSTPGTQWDVDPTSNTDLEFLTFQDSNNIGSERPAILSTDGGNNINWDFNAPNNPASLGPAGYVNGGWGNDNTPTLTFNLTDPDTTDTVGYWIQVANNSGFSGDVVDYISGMGAQGSASFTVGQATGSGSYTTGSAGQTLPDGTYYWRVRTIDSGTLESTGFTTANSGSVAFKVDTVTPTAPGTPSTTASPTGDNTPTLSWTAGSDSDSGLGSPAYTIEWSQDPGFSGLGGDAGIDTTSYTIPSWLALSDGTWYFRVLATDAAGNNSPFSSAASVVINTVAPTITSITVSSITKASASITWITDQQASSQIAYGRTDSYGSATTETDTSPRVTSHRVVLTGLAACTSYHYRATSVDALGNAGHSSDKTFKTAGCATPLRPTPAQNTSQSEPTIQQSQNSDATKSKPKDNSDSSQPTSSDTSPPTAKSENTNNDQGPSKNTSTFLGLGWWWLLVLTLAASLWWLIILGRRRKREGTGR